MMVIYSIICGHVISGRQSGRGMSYGSGDREHQCKDDD